jgi:hypothetical protein
MKSRRDDTFDPAAGGMCIAAGNGIAAGTPLANIEAFLDEACRNQYSRREPIRKPVSIPLPLTRRVAMHAPRSIAAALAAVCLWTQAWAQTDRRPVVDPLRDTSIYPIAVWSMPARTARAFAALGVNLFVAGEDNARGWCDTLAMSRCAGFVGWSSRYSAAQREAIAGSPGFLGWMHGDEPDNPDVVDDVFRAYHVPPERLLADYQAMRASSTPASMYLNLGQGLANGMAQSTPDSVYPAFARTADILCYDVYPVSTQENGVDRLPLVARGLARLKRFAGPGKPVWIWLECTRLDGARSGVGNRCPLPHELRAEIWMSILYGADGIGYFPHQFNPYRGGPEAIPAGIQAEMRLTNGLLHRLAPLLRTGDRARLPVDPGRDWVSASLWLRGGQALLVAVNMRNEPARATVLVPAGLTELSALGGAGRGRPVDGTLTLALQPYEVAVYGSGFETGAIDYRYPGPAAAAEEAAGEPALRALAELPETPESGRGIAWSRTQNTRIAVPDLPAAPAIDGKLDDPAWRLGAELGLWTHPEGTGAPVLQTAGVLGQFGGKVFLAFRADETELDSLVTRYETGWRNDCVEAWFDPDNRRTSFAHLVATSQARVEAWRTVPDEWGEGRRDEAWQPRVACRAGRTPGAWTVEMALDLADLGISGEQPVVGFDAARERKPGGGENSAWTLGGFNAARYFGELVFAPAAVTLANGRLRNRGPRPVSATVEVLVSAPRQRDSFATWEEKWADLARQILSVQVPPAGDSGNDTVPLLGPELSRRVPPGGRVRLTLLAPGPVQFEEFIANPLAAGE